MTLATGALDDATWESRHRALVALLVVQIAALTIWTLASGASAPHMLGDIAILAVLGALALRRSGSRAVRSCAVALGLFTVSALVVHLAGGGVSAHFHYFVMLAVLALYEDIRPYALGVAYVVLQHGVLGSLAPYEVFGDSEQAEAPVQAALVHGAFVLAASAGHFATWRAGAAVRRRLAEEEQRLQSYFRLAGSLFVVLDRDGCVRAANRRTCEVLGRELDDVIGQDWVELALPPAERPIARRMLSRLLEQEGDDPYPYEGPLVRADGSIRQIDWQVARGPDGVVGSGHDVTERRGLEAQLRREQGDLAALRSMALAVASGDDPREDVVLEARTLLDARRVELVEPGLGVTAAAGESSGADADRLVSPVVFDGREIGQLVVELDGRPADARAHTLVRSVCEKLALALERRDVLRRLEEAARTDALTGVANRRAFDEALPAALARAERSRGVVALALMDLNGFKQVNDRDGHEAGDRLLRHATAAWTGQLRAGDLLARIGGDEFAVLLPDCSGLDEAERVAERLRGALDHPPGAGVGVVVWDRRESPDALLRRADRALYADKPLSRR